MSKKQLQVDEIMNELEGASLFFQQPPAPAANPTPPPEPEPQPIPTPLPTTDQVSVGPVSLTSEAPPTTQISNENGIKPGTLYNESKSSRASKQASTHFNKPHDLIKTIRKTVKQVGKEVLFVRVSPTEKHTLGSIVYSFNEIYRGEGRKTSENEIGRIGLNFLLEDYRENGNNSILAQVLAALAA